MEHLVIGQIGQELTEILSENKKIMAWEIDIAPRTMSCIIKQNLELRAFKQQTGQCLTVALKENTKINQDTCCCKKILLWRKLSISKKIEFIQGSPQIGVKD